MNVIFIVQEWFPDINALGRLASANLGLEALAVGVALVLHSCATQPPSLGWQYYRCFLGRFSEPVGSRLSMRYLGANILSSEASNLFDCTHSPPTPGI